MASIPTDLYDLLVYILNTKQPKEIEILSLPYDNGGVLPDGAEKELAPYLFAENSLGIPKKILVKAFLSARTILNTCINQKINFDDVTAEDAKRLDGMTKVMLLFDSEHQTVVNIRKRLIRQTHISPSTELDVLNTLFTSPLNRHTKSPLLWTHRRFLIPLLQSTHSLPDVMNELNIIFAAAERHPKNYHAWTYARFITTYLFRNDSSTKHLLPVVFARVRGWCEMHPSDISGWIFLLWFCGQPRPWDAELKGVVMAEKVVEEVVEGMRLRSGHEAQWAFVRGAVVGMEGVIQRGEGEEVLKRVREYGRLLENKMSARTKEEERDKLFLERYFSDSGKENDGISWYGIIQAYGQGNKT